MTLADANWTAVGQVATLNTPIAGPLLAGAKTSVNIKVKIAANFTGTSLMNFSQIKSTEDDKGNKNPKDKDSTPGSGFNKGEDDDSKAPVTIKQTFDLALTKTLTSAGVVMPGDTATFKLEVENQGTVTAKNIVLSDSLPVGMTLADPMWTADATGRIATMNSPIAGPLVAGAKTSVTIKVKIDANFTGITLTNYAQIKSDEDDKGNKNPKDKDSTPGSGFNKGEDDDSKAPIKVDKLVKGSIGNFVWIDANDNGIQDVGEVGVPGVKVILWTNNGGKPGSIITSMVTGPNGEYLFSGLDKGDYFIQFDPLTLPDSLNLSNKPNTGSDALDSDADPLTGITQLVSLDPIKGGILKDNLTLDAGVTLFNLGLNKTLVTTGDVKPGDVVTFKLTVTNKGSQTATAIALTDSLPAGMTLADPNWTAAGQIATLNTPIAGPLAPKATASVDIKVKIDAGFTGTVLMNYAQIKDAKDDKGKPRKDVNSTPGNGFNKGEDDDSKAPVNIKQPNTFDLALAKTLVTTGAVKAGDVVTFKLTVTNQGDVAATKVALKDSLQAGMTLADANWTAAGAIATLNTPIAGPIAPGASASVDIKVKINADFTGTSLMNFAQISDAKGPNGETVKDKDSTPGNGFDNGEDDASKAPVAVGPCAIPPTPTCAGTVSNECPKVCVNLNDYKQSDVRTEGGMFEWHSGPTPTAANLVADPTCVKTSGKYFLFEKATCGVYSNGALIEVKIIECPKADLSLTKMVSNKTPKKDDVITYTIKVKNAGPATATNVEISDKVPVGLSFVSVGAGLTQAAGMITGKVASIAKGDSAMFTYTAKVTGSGSITNYAEVSKSDQPDPNSTPGNNNNGTGKNEDDDDNATIVVRENCDIPPTPTCGGMVSNVCPSICVNLNDQIQSAIRTVGGKFEWHSGSIPTAANLVADPTCVKTSGRFYLFELAGCGEYSNGALLEVKIVPCAPQVADLSLTKTVSKTAVMIGDTIKYTVTVKNAGPDAATNVEVSDKLPAGLSFVSGGTGVTQTTGMITGKVASIAKGASATFTYMAKVTAAGSLKNMAEVSKSDQNDPNSTPGNAGTKHEDDDDAITVEAKDPNCAIPPTPTCGGPRVVNCPTDGCVNINLFIQSSIRTAGGVHEWHTSPAPTAANLISDPTCVKASGSYYVFEKAACGEYSNAALLMLTIEPCVDKKIDVSIAMAVSNSTPSIGDEVTYTITVSNAAGMATATNVKVTDLLPAGLQFVSSTDFTAVGGVLTSNNIPSIAAGGSVTLTFKAKVTADGPLVNKAQVTAHDQVDVDSAKDNGYDNGEDDRASVTIDTKKVCDLKALVLACAKPDICPGESATITVTANGCEGGVVAWSNGLSGNSIVVTPNITTGYTATCTKGGCVSPISNTITVSVATPAVPVVTASTTTVCANGTATLTASGCSGTVMWSNGVAGIQITVSPTATTVYTAMCKIGNCMSANSTPVTITIGNPSAPTISASPKTLLCAGETVNLTSTGCEGGSVVWSNGTVGASITVSPMATTEYTAKCKIADCTSAASNTVKITVNTVGSAPTVTASKNSICTGESVTLSATGCDGGTINWSNGATGNSITVSPTTSTTYQASCKGATGKCDSAPASVTVSVGSNTQPVTIAASPSGTVCAGGNVTLTATGCAGGTVTWSTGATGSSVVVTPTGTTTYSATCKIGTCESAPATTTVTVTPRPEKPLVTCSTENICPGESVTLEVKNCTGTVVWSTGAVGVTAVAVTPTITTTYTAICKVGTCESEVSKNYTITVTPVTTPTLTASKTTIAKGETVKLTAAGCNGEVIWSNGMTGSEILVAPQASTSYTAICKKGVCTSATSAAVVVNVTDTKPVLVANADATTTPQGTKVNISLLSNDKATDGTTADLTKVTLPVVVTSPLNGTVTIKADGTADYTPNADFSGTDTFTYKICDKTDATNCSTTTVTITVPRVIDPGCTTPSATPIISASATSIGEAVLTASGCTGGTITWSNGKTGSSIGISLTVAGSYTATCKVGNCPASPASVPVTITPTQTTTVVANADGASTPQGTKVNISILSNDKAADGTVADLTKVTLPVVVTGPLNGTVTIKADGTADYTPNAGFTGTDTFTYKICDKTDGTKCSTTTVTVTVSGTPGCTTPSATPIISASATSIGESVLTASGCTGGTITWSNGKTGSSISISLTVAGSYTAICKVGDCPASPASVPVTITPVTPTEGFDLSLKKALAAGQSASVNVGDVVNYTLTLKNEGTIAATQINMKDKLPAGLEVADVQWVAVTANNEYRLATPIASLAPGASLNITVRMRVAVGATGTLTNNAQIYTAKDGNGNSATDKDSSPDNGYTNGEDDESSAAVTVGGGPIDPTACAAPVISGGTTICNGLSATLTAAGCEGGVITWSNGMTGASITVSPVSTTTYTASCKKANCTGSVASNGATVTVNTANPPTVVYSAAAICKGGSVAISANGCAGTVTWSNGQVGASINVSPETTTTYTAKCKVGNCESAASTNAVITVTIPATPTVAASATKVCYGSPVTLSAGGNCTGYFTWSNGLVGNSITIIPTTTASYTATCCTSTNCKSALSNAVSVEVTVGVAKPEVKNLSNACPFKKVDLTQGVTSTMPAGMMVEFHAGNSITSPLVANPTAIEVSGTYYAFYRSATGCASEGAAINVMISGCSDTPDCEKNPATANAGASSSICAALSYKLSGKIGGVATSATWTTNGAGTFSNAMALDAIYYPTIAEIVKGSTVLTLTTNDPDGAGSCKAATSSMTLTFEGIKIRPQMVINGIAKADTLPVTLNICSTDSLVLEAQETGYDYKWFKNGVVVPAFTNMKKIVVRESGTYSYGLIDAKRCCSVPSARVTINIPTTSNATNLTAKNVCPATVIDLTKSLPQTTDLAAVTFKTGMGAAGMTVANPTQAAAGTYYVYSKSGNCSVLQSIITATITTCGTVPPTDTTKAKPSIGVALAVKESVKQADGSFNVAYLVTVKNTGNVPLTDVQLKDSIGTQIKAPATYTVVGPAVFPNGSTSSLTSNSSYNGTSNLNILGTGSTLGVGKEETIVVVYNVKPNGSTAPVLGNVVASANGGTTPVKDVSNTGTTVNQPASTPTTVRFDLPTSLMGLAKSVGVVENLGNNKYKIPYTIKVSNVGTTDLKKVQVMDDLALTFGSKAIVIGKPVILADSGFVVDTNYTGQGARTKMLVDSLSNLAKGTSRTIRLLVTIAATNVDSSTVFNNIALGKAMAGQVAVTDSSTSGSNIDPDNDLDPRNNSNPTPVTLNSLPGKGLIGSALSIKDTIVQGDGSMNITYRVIIKNYGSKLVSNVQLKDSLSTVFNILTGATFKVINTPTANDSSELRINPDFDGVKDNNLLIAEQSRLSAGKMDSVFFTVNVKTDGRLTPYLNRVCARAISGKDTLVDLSMNGLNPDPNGNNNPTELTEAEPTPVVIRAEGGELFVPEGFSPNGDGINDKFVIRHPAGTKVVIEIYNRWMHQVYRNDDYQNDWDGSSNIGGQTAQGLPVGTYYYNVVMQDANGVESKRVVRFMTINR
jgi:uncharacterized repeat protein (TIGR01451 family)/gliding motility-associated-like protein